MDRRYQVMQYVAVVKSTWGRFRVFTCGDLAFYLFSQIDPDGCDTGLQFPVKRSDLRREVRSALAHGWGNSL